MVEVFGIDKRIIRVIFTKVRNQFPKKLKDKNLSILMILRYVLAAGIRGSPVKFPSLIPCLIIIIAGSNISLQRIEFTQEMNYTAYYQNLMKEQN